MNDEVRPFCEVLAERQEERERKRDANRARKWQSLAEWHEANVTQAKSEPLQDRANVGFEHIKRR